MGEDGFVIDKLNADGLYSGGFLNRHTIPYRCPCFDGVGKRHGVLWTFCSHQMQLSIARYAWQISHFFEKQFQGKRPHFNGHDIREGFHYRPLFTFLRRKRRCHRPWRLRCVGGVFWGDLWLIVYLRIFSFCHFARKKVGKECSTILWWWLESWYTFSQMPLPRKFRWGVFKTLEAESMMNIWSNQGYIGEELSVPFGNASQYWHVFVYCICLAVCLLVHLCIYLFVCMSASLFVWLSKHLFRLFSILVFY